MRRTLVITGCHRSGTSAVAGMVDAGAPDVDFGRVNRQYLADNPRGNMENPDLVEVNDALCGGWQTPSEPSEEVTEANLGRMQTVLEQNYPDELGPDEWWAMKDPRFAFTLGAWGSLLGEVSVLWCSRPVYQVVQSLIIREKAIYGRTLEAKTALEMITRYVVRLGTMPRETALIGFGGDRNSPNDDIAAAAELLRFSYDPAAGAAFYSRDLVHHRD